MRIYSVVRIGSFPSRTVSQSRKSLLLLFLTGLIIALAAQSWEKTSLTACINGSISLPGDDSRRLAEQSWWKARYQDDSWIKIGFCARTKGCTTSTRVLTDGTRLWIGRNRTLFVTHTAGNQKNATQQLQFLREDDLDRRHIYVVNFTVHCKLPRFFILLEVIESRNG